MIDGTTYVTSHTLRVFKEKLRAYPLFIEPYKAYIVHLTHVTAIERSRMQIRLKNRAVVPISRDHMKAVLGEYMRMVRDDA